MAAELNKHTTVPCTPALLISGVKNDFSSATPTNGFLLKIFNFHSRHRMWDFRFVSPLEERKPSMYEKGIHSSRYI